MHETDDPRSSKSSIVKPTLCSALSSCFAVVTHQRRPPTPCSNMWSWRKEKLDVSDPHNSPDMPCLTRQNLPGRAISLRCVSALSSPYAFPGAPYPPPSTVLAQPSHIQSPFGVPYQAVGTIGYDVVQSTGYGKPVHFSQIFSVIPPRRVEKTDYKLSSLG